MGNEHFRIIHMYNTTGKPVVFAVADSESDMNEFDTDGIEAMSVCVYFDNGIVANILDNDGNWIELG